MWKYKQSTGQLFDPAGVQVDLAWSGYGDNRNRPELQSVKQEGPIPRGKYTIGQAYRHHKLGKLTMNLEPFAENEMFGRSLFRFHGYSKDNPDTVVNETYLSSHGCICTEYLIRVMISESDDRVLEVVE